MSFQSHIEAILKPCRSHITIVGTNMASIWLRYGFDMAFKGVIWKLYGNYPGVFKEFSGNLGTIFFELLNRFWIPVSYSSVNIQQKQEKDVEFGEYFINSVKYLCGY